MNKIERNGNRISIDGKIFSNESHLVLCNIYQAFKEKGYQDLVLDFFRCEAIFSDVMLSVCSYALKFRDDGLNIKLILPARPTLERLFYNSNWAHLIDPEHCKPSQFRGYRQVPATQYRDPDEQTHALKQVINSLLMSYTDLHRSDFAAIEWSLNEIMDNVLVHSESNFGGLVQLTTFNNYNKKIEFIVSDGGNGIPCTLKPHISEINTDIQALNYCIREGVTNGKGQGNGLFGSYNICSLSKGSFLIDSGGARLYYNDRDGMHIRPNSIPLGGTTVVANINCNSEGVLEKALTFKNRVHHPIDFIENEYETENDDVVIHIKKEVSSTGSRIAGEPLRRKLKSIYGMTESKIVMNFDSIAIISSSFGDELIAKLVIDIGIDKFKSRFSFANINDTVFMLIDKSVQQRLIKSDKARPITSVDALWR